MAVATAAGGALLAEHALTSLPALPCLLPPSAAAEMHRLRLDMQVADKERSRLEGRLQAKEREIGGLTNKARCIRAAVGSLEEAAAGDWVRQPRMLGEAAMGALRLIGGCISCGCHLGGSWAVQAALHAGRSLRRGWAPLPLLLTSIIP